MLGKGGEGGRINKTTNPNNGSSRNVIKKKNNSVFFTTW